MLLFEGEPALFFLFIISTLSLLVGGCLWGSGEDEGATTKMTIGIVVFTLGCITTLTFFITYTISDQGHDNEAVDPDERTTTL
uniref:SJCHGC02425 protein n=1 Tax=Schistosoma japonicum TaxID=6182 RepID=Q5BT83_SCHJA|nr:SJCHGC02425 protein [Schistosoma japonicum]